MGYATRLMEEGELRRQEPRVQFGRVEAAAYAEQVGHVDPVHALDVLLQQARRWGTRVETTCEVTGLDLRNGGLRAVKTSKGEIEAQVLVIACGVDTARLAALAGLTPCRSRIRPAPWFTLHHYRHCSIEWS
jgi:glycine/D-amino acid oxidase-like deaminating enzyme